MMIGSEIKRITLFEVGGARKGDGLFVCIVPLPNLAIFPIIKL